jgi:hypothetical protein
MVADATVLIFDVGFWKNDRMMARTRPPTKANKLVGQTQPEGFRLAHNSEVYQIRRELVCAAFSRRRMARRLRTTSTNNNFRDGQRQIRAGALACPTTSIRPHAWTTLTNKACQLPAARRHDDGHTKKSIPPPPKSTREKRRSLAIIRILTTHKRQEKAAMSSFAMYENVNTNLHQR